jgi:DNA-directed RNA polymerase specialized sigma24 family protein
LDRELLVAARSGDEAAFVDLIRARSNRLFAIAQRILRDIDRAEDALQDALVPGVTCAGSAIRTGSMPG